MRSTVVAPIRQRLADYGMRLRRARTNAGLSLTELADKCGVSRSSLLDAEWGRRAGSLTVLYACADALKVDAGWLLTGGRAAELEADPDVLARAFLDVFTEVPAALHHLQTALEATGRATRALARVPPPKPAPPRPDPPDDAPPPG